MLLARYTSSASGCLRVIPRLHLKRHPLHDPPRRAHDSDEVGTVAANLEHPALQPAAGEVDEPVRADRRCRFPPRCSAAKRRRRRPRPNAATGGRRPMSAVDQAAPEDRSTLPAIRTPDYHRFARQAGDRPWTSEDYQRPTRRERPPRGGCGEPREPRFRARPTEGRTSKTLIACARAAEGRVAGEIPAKGLRTTNKTEMRPRRKVGLTTDGYTLSLPTPSASFGRPSAECRTGVAGTLGPGAALIVVQVRSGPCVMAIDEVICTFGQASSYPQIRHHQRSSW